MEIYDLKAHHINSDIKAEIIAADLVENGLDLDDIVITPIGMADRVFSRDIHDISPRPDKQGLRDLLAINVTREGLYNSLPEALFHVFDRGKKSNAAGFVDEYKKHKQEEDTARQFFLAFEKEIYRLRTLLELNEQHSILGFSDQLKSDLFLNLWPELQDIDSKYVGVMVLILPISHKVIGNTNLAARLLSYLVNETVKIDYSHHTRSMPNPTDSNVLGKNYVGYDLIIGDELPDFTPQLEVAIGPLKKGDLMRFMPGGETRKVLDLAFKYLLPVAVDINVTLLLDNFAENLILSDELNEGILGFTSRL